MVEAEFGACDHRPDQMIQSVTRSSIKNKDQIVRIIEQTGAKALTQMNK